MFWLSKGMSVVRIGLFGLPIASLAGAALLTANPPAVLASANGVVPARTGGFGEMTCHQCHSNNPLNDAAGRLDVAGIPNRYALGASYVITVRVSHPKLVRAGFQLSARFVTGGANAGRLQPADERTEAVPDDGGRITYIQHTSVGADPDAEGMARWLFRWTAPEMATPIVFHLAGNAANGDGLSTDDFIYTATVESRPSTVPR